MGAISDVRDEGLADRTPTDRSSRTCDDRLPAEHLPSVRIVRWTIASLVLVCLAIGLVRPAPAAAAVTVGGPFSLTAPDGTIVTDRTYGGRWLLVYFGYRSCPDSCPTALLAMSETMKALGPDAVETQPIFITLDPQRDTREVLKEFVASFDPRIVALTGTQDKIDAVVQAYGAYVVRRQTGPGPDDYLIDHSVYIYLMRPGGAFVRAFDTHWPATAIADAVRAAMKGDQRGPGPIDPASTLGAVTSASGQAP